MILKNLGLGPLLYARPSVVLAAAVAAFALMLVPALLLVLDPGRFWNVPLTLTSIFGIR